MATVQGQILRVAPPLRRPTQDEIQQAIELCHRIGPKSAEGVADSPPSVRLSIRDSDGSESEVDLPPLAFAVLEYLLAEMAAGNGVMLTRLRPELTPFEAAGLLGVSPSYLTELMESGELPCHESGAARRIVFDDLMAYQKKDDEATSKILDELVAQAQELGLGY